MDSLDAADGEEDSIEANVEDKAEANRTDETTRSNGLKEEGRGRSHLDRMTAGPHPPKDDGDDTADSASNDSSYEEESLDGLGRRVDRRLDTDLENDGDADESQGKEAGQKVARPAISVTVEAHRQTSNDERAPRTPKAGVMTVCRGSVLFDALSSAVAVEVAAGAVLDEEADADADVAEQGLL